MKEFRDKQLYTNTYENLLNKKSREQAMREAVGGSGSVGLYDAIGRIEASILRYHGLQPHQHLVDVGCGSGRLAKPLSECHSGKYSGFDIVKVAVDYARETVNRPDWRFEEIDSIAIPEPDQSCDMVCFFSVFTHLFHDQSYQYLKECVRVLNPGGKVIFSFLERRSLHHWKMVVYGTLKHLIQPKDKHMNVFISRKQIKIWANQLGLQLEKIHNASDNPWGDGALGQSICVLSKT